MADSKRLKFDRSAIPHGNTVSADTAAVTAPVSNKKQSKKAKTDKSGSASTSARGAVPPSTSGVAASTNTAPGSDIHGHSKQTKKRKRAAAGASTSAGEAPPPATKRKRVAAGTSAISFPSPKAPRFGLIQEELAGQPFRLLVAVVFLNKTSGHKAVPVFRKLMERYPTPVDLANAEFEEVYKTVESLGLQTSRTKTLISLAQDWLKNPPCKGVRYKAINYPEHGMHTAFAKQWLAQPREKNRFGKDKLQYVESDSEECAGALEIAHLCGFGSYAFDSWRIFCRDVLRGVATGYNGEGAADGFEPEWKRVVPKDKELRACLRWM